MTGLRRRISILGATGSIGLSAASVVESLRRDPANEIDVVALSVGRNVDGLCDLVDRLRPELVAIADPAAAEEARARLAGKSVRLAVGPQAAAEAAEAPADWVISAIVGLAALEPTLAAIRRGASVALANKECLVSAGPLMLAAARASGATLLPVDSEHNAIFQVWSQPHRVERVTITASGGPFRTWDRASMAAATPEQALKHPNWAMGAKNTIDSASLMNKGLELIEAAHFFDLPGERVEVLVHPQSIVHGLVTYCDGSVLAQLSAPDMRVPIANALAWPDRAAPDVRRLDLAEIGSLTFERPDLERFPALRVAREALAAGGGAPAAFNAANEIAVELFLGGRIGFLDIAALVSDVLEAMIAQNTSGIAKSPSSFDHVHAVDAAARELALAWANGTASRSAGVGALSGARSEA